MQITITSSLTEEQALILAVEKGYSEMIVEDMNVFPNVFIPNPSSPFSFLKDVYENMIKEDAKRLFITYDDRINIDAKNLREQNIKDMVDSAFL